MRLTSQMQAQIAEMRCPAQGRPAAVRAQKSAAAHHRFEHLEGAGMCIESAKIYAPKQIKAVNLCARNYYAQSKRGASCLP